VGQRAQQLGDERRRASRRRAAEVAQVRMQVLAGAGAHVLVRVPGGGRRRAAPVDGQQVGEGLEHIGLEPPAFLAVAIIAGERGAQGGAVHVVAEDQAAQIVERSPPRGRPVGRGRDQRLEHQARRGRGRGRVVLGIDDHQRAPRPDLRVGQGPPPGARGRPARR
jgi:hypothetical protein